MLSLEIPMGFYIDYVRTATNWFRLIYPNIQSASSLEWLAHIAISQDNYIQQAGNSNKKELGMKKLHNDG